MTSSCVFCLIIQKKVPATILAETDTVLAFKDRAPKASHHYLIIPKNHMADLHEAEVKNKDVLGELLLMAKQLSETIEGAHDFNLVVNNGTNAGQVVPHLHMHFLAGKRVGLLGL
jgi:histidine triad (HIT) family protein